MKSKQEVKGKDQLRQAMDSYTKVIDLIQEGKIGKKVSFPLNQASLALRISQETLEAMGERGQKLGISVEEDRLVVRLFAGEKPRKEAYKQLFLIAQGLRDGQATRLLQKFQVSSSLLKEFPELKEWLPIIKEGRFDLSSDLPILHIWLWGLYYSLEDKSGLVHPANLF